ncbi:MAG: hypothetical protein LIO65_10330 [Odoribacter sp.]|nr:hypothetical protein [Odoribacter sp.]
MINSVILKICIVVFIIISGFVVKAQNAELKEGFYPDGKLRYRGYFVGETPHSEVTQYFPDGRIKAKLNYQGEETIAELHSKDGKFIASGKYINRQKEGEWNYKREDKIRATENYRAGNLNEIAIKYYNSGAEAEIKNWKEGVWDGEWKMFYDNGQVRLQAFFKEGKLDGIVKSYNPQGILIVEGNYKGNLKTGLWCYFDDSGNLKKEVLYIEGKAESSGDKDIKENEELDKLIKEGQKIPDPANFEDNPDLYLQIITG